MKNKTKSIKKDNREKENKLRKIKSNNKIVYIKKIPEIRRKKMKENGCKKIKAAKIPEQNICNGHLAYLLESISFKI